MACRISNCEINRWIWSASVRGKGDPSIAVSRHKREYWCHTPQGSVSDAQTERNRTPLRNLTPVSFKLHGIRKAFTQLSKLPPCTIHQYITEVHDTSTASPIIPAAQTRCFISTPAPLSLSAEGQGRETWVGRTKLAIMSGMIMAVLHSDPSAPSFKFSVMMGLNFFFFFLSPALEKNESLTSADTHEKNDPFESKVIASNEPAVSDYYAIRSKYFISETPSLTGCRAL